MYKIIIEKIEEKEVNKREYTVIGEKDGKNEYGYVEVPNIEKVNTKIYEQTIESEDFNIKSVIDAFNTNK